MGVRLRRRGDRPNRSRIHRSDHVPGLLNRPRAPGGSQDSAGYECPSSAVSSSGITGTEPESGAGRRGNGSTRVSSITGDAGWGGLGMTAASEWPPQPYANDTTWPSAGENSFAQTPKAWPREPPIAWRKPQLTQGAGAAW